MNRPSHIVVRLLGPSLADVVSFVSTLGAGGERVIAWDSYPEVHVKCPLPGIGEALVGRFGADVYSVTGQPIEVVTGGALVAAGLTLATAESCTGGLVGHMLTGVPGISECFLGGVVAYSNDSKVSLLGVPEELIARHGAVSRPVASAMAEGARRALGASIGVGISGIAGPGGGTPQKPVGTVWVAVSGSGRTRARRLFVPGPRERVKLASAFHALDMVRREALGLAIQEDADA